jgi:hypothetical protein
MIRQNGYGGYYPLHWYDFIINPFTFGAVLIALACWWTRQPENLRDPRCDTAARYEAMREGATCQ